MPRPSLEFDFFISRDFSSRLLPHPLAARRHLCLSSLKRFPCHRSLDASSKISPGVLLLSLAKVRAFLYTLHPVRLLLQPLGIVVAFIVFIFAAPQYFRCRA